MTSFREELFAYVKKKYNTTPEYPWRRYLDYAVFRHEDNNKWYGLTMDVPRYKLGKNESGRTVPGDSPIGSFDGVENGTNRTVPSVPLARDYGIVTVRGPRGIPDSLSDALKG